MIPNARPPIFQGDLNEPELLSEEPKILLWPNFLTKKECKQIISLGTKRLSRSTVVKLGNQITNERTSYTTNFLKGEGNVIKKLENKISMVCGYSKKNIEPIQLVKYNPGQYFKHHYDFFAPCQEISKKEMKRGGQRVLTFFIYLNDVEGKGGATDFPKIP
jgi:prolyl 4-hydroxylase